MTLPKSGACAALLLMVAALPVSAQTPAPSPAPDAPITKRSIQYGVKFGPSFTTLTSVETFDDTVAAAAREPTMNFGGFVTINMVGGLDFQPEVLFAAKGHRIHDKDAPPTLTGSGSQAPRADRVILLRYLEIPLLVRASRRSRADTSLYVIAGPAFAIRRNAVIREVRDSGRHEDIADQVTGSNMSVVFGGGLQRHRWIVDARLTKGVRNVAVFPQPAAVKTNAFSVMLGVRL